MYSKILFLDFDGVLHSRTPKSSGEMFRGLSLLEKCLQELPDVGIVITSSWRSHPKDLEHAYSKFPTGIRDRVLGETPVFGDRKEREREILDWMATHRVSSNDVVILDDEADLFSNLNNRLVTVNGLFGIREKDLKRLASLIQSKLKPAN